MNITCSITGLQHVGIPSSNLKKTIEFYEELGFTLVLHTINPVTDEKVCFLKLKNLCIEAWQSDRAAKVSGAIDHIALDVTDIVKTFVMVKSGGFILLDKEIQTLPFWSRGVRFFTILGPDGEKIEFSQIM